MPRRRNACLVELQEAILDQFAASMTTGEGLVPRPPGAADRLTVDRGRRRPPLDDGGVTWCETALPTSVLATVQAQRNLLSGARYGWQCLMSSAHG